MRTARTFGPAFSGAADGPRLALQQEAIRRYMLVHDWRTLWEISYDLSFPESSVSAQLRHLRKPEFGGYVVEKRRRGNSGTWEYRVREPQTVFDSLTGQGHLFPEEPRGTHYD